MGIRIAQGRPRCIHCSKEKGLHRAKTAECPAGMKTRIGYCEYGPGTFEAEQLEAPALAEMFAKEMLANLRRNVAEDKKRRGEEL